MANTTVLLIDYEPASIEKMKAPLLAAGYTVEVVKDGVAGLKAFSEMKPDLVLIEAMIPKKHGFEVCQEIKNLPEGKNTPVVIATSIYKGRKYRNQALRTYGCDEYLEKPVEGEKLMEVCHKLLGDLEEQIDQVKASMAATDTGGGSGVAEPGGNKATEATLQTELDSMSDSEISERLDAVLGGLGRPDPVAASASVGVDEEDLVADVPDVEMQPVEEPALDAPPRTKADDRDPGPDAPSTPEVETETDTEAEKETNAKPEPAAAPPAASAAEQPAEPVEPEAVEPSVVVPAPELVEPEPVVREAEDLGAAVPETTGERVRERIESTPEAAAEAAGTTGTVTDRPPTGAGFPRLGTGVWAGLAAVLLVAVGAVVMMRGGGEKAETPAGTPQVEESTQDSFSDAASLESPVSQVAEVRPDEGKESGEPLDAEEPATAGVKTGTEKPNALKAAETGNGAAGTEDVPVKAKAAPVKTKSLPAKTEALPAKTEPTPKAAPVEEAAPEEQPSVPAAPAIETPDTPEASSVAVTGSVTEAAHEPGAGGDESGTESAAPLTVDKEPIVQPIAPLATSKTKIDTDTQKAILPVQLPPEPLKAHRGELIPLGEVDVQPVQIRKVEPRYHPTAQRLGQEGTVQLNLLIDETGVVTDIQVLKEIPNSQLNNMAVLAARRWVYMPAMKDGVPVKVWKRVAIEFRL